MEQRRIFSASDLAQFEYCPLAWWYEEVSDLAQADQDELAGRLKELEDEYGASAISSPEYQVIKRLHDRAGRFAQGHEQQAADGSQRQASQTNERTIVAPVPHIFGLLVVGLSVLTVVLLGVGLLLWVR
ncbi:MAG TPA: hypothetical protein VH590_09790 [Ktedonobacterales bacterium]